MKLARWALVALVITVAAIPAAGAGEDAAAALVLRRCRDPECEIKGVADRMLGRPDCRRGRGHDRPLRVLDRRHWRHWCRRRGDRLVRRHGAERRDSWFRGTACSLVVTRCARRRLSLTSRHGTGISGVHVFNLSSLDANEVSRNNIFERVDRNPAVGGAIGLSGTRSGSHPTTASSCAAPWSTGAYVADNQSLRVGSGSSNSTVGRTGREHGSRGNTGPGLSCPTLTAP